MILRIKQYPCREFTIVIVKKQTKIIYLNCVEIYEGMDDHRSSIDNLNACG